MRNFEKVEKNQFGQNVGAVVTLPIIKNDQLDALDGQYVHLIQLCPDSVHDSVVDELWQAIQDEADARCWTYLPYEGFTSRHELKTQLINKFNFSDSIHYLIEMNGQKVGWIGLLNIRSAHLAIEIGNVYFSARMKRSIAATETIYLLLKECFENHYRRIEWKCDALNEPSQLAALRFGFEYEGTFRQDRIVKGRNRNTAWFSMLDDDWQYLEPAYKAWLESSNFDEHGQQKIKLQDFKKLYR